MMIEIVTERWRETGAFLTPETMKEVQSESLETRGKFNSICSA